MPLPLLALGAISALPSLFKASQGLSQLNKANKVKLQDNVPAAFKEQMGLLRQEAGGMMPGYGQMSNQLAQGQAATSAAITRTGASPAAVTAALAGADARRQQGVMQLGLQNQQYGQQARRNLGTGLLQLANYQKAA